MFYNTQLRAYWTIIFLRLPLGQSVAFMFQTPHKRGENLLEEVVEKMERLMKVELEEVISSSRAVLKIETETVNGPCWIPLFDLFLVFFQGRQYRQEYTLAVTDENTRLGYVVFPTKLELCRIVSPTTVIVKATTAHNVSQYWELNKGFGDVDMVRYLWLYYLLMIIKENQYHHSTRINHVSCVPISRSMNLCLRQDEPVRLRLWEWKWRVVRFWLRKRRLSSW